MAVLTQLVQLKWRPELGFYEQRSELLRDLEHEGLLEEFGWAVGEVRAKISDAEYVTIGFDGVSGSVVGTGTSTERVRRAISRILDRLSPQSVVLESGQVRFVLPLDVKVAQAAAGLTGDLMGEVDGLRPIDCALLVDGLSERVGSPFKVEFGVVGREELVERLRYALGRLDALPAFSPIPGAGALPGPPVPPAEDVPACGLFFDWLWTPMLGLGGNIQTSATTAWDELMAETDRLSREMHDGHVAGIFERWQGSGGE